MVQERVQRPVASTGYLEGTPACWRWPAPHIAGRIVGETCRTTANRHLQALDRWQAGRCAICGRQFRHGGRYDLVLDHDHGTDLTRGLLCNGCNMAEGRSNRDVFRAYRRRYPVTILGLTLPYRGGCADASCDCCGRTRKDWLTAVIESGVANLEQLGTLQDLLQLEMHYSTCVSVGGVQCCQHGPWTLPPPGRARCPVCWGWGFSSAERDGCARCEGNGHLAVAPTLVVQGLDAAVRDLQAVIGKQTWGVDAASLTDDEVGAADLAARLFAQAATVLRNAGLSQGGRDI
jgi:hypothetical protein